MPIDYLNTLTPLVCLTLNVAVQITSFRYITGLSLLNSVFFGFGIGFIGVLGIEAFMLLVLPAQAKDIAPTVLTDIIIYSVLGYCYFHFVNMGETARRLRILLELFYEKNGLSMQEIVMRYGAREIIEKRLARLIANGQIVSKNGSYYIGNPVMLTISTIMRWMRVIVFGKRVFL